MKINSAIASRHAFQSAQFTQAKRPAAEGASPTFALARQRAGDTVILSRAAAQSRPQHAQDSQAPQNASKDATPPAPLSANPLPASRGAQATFGQSDLDAINGSFGRRSGEEGFSEQADADGNGIIDFRDMTHVLANWGQTRS